MLRYFLIVFEVFRCLGRYLFCLVFLEDFKVCEDICVVYGGFFFIVLFWFIVFLNFFGLNWSVVIMVCLILVMYLVWGILGDEVLLYWENYINFRVLF